MKNDYSQRYEKRIYAIDTMATAKIMVTIEASRHLSEDEEKALMECAADMAEEAKRGLECPRSIVGESLDFLDYAYTVCNPFPETEGNE